MRIIQKLSGFLTILVLTTQIHARKIEVGQIAPGFTLEKYGGGTISLNDYAGKVVIIYFFGSY